MTLRTRILPFCLLFSSFGFRCEQSKWFSKHSKLLLGGLDLQPTWIPGMESVYMSVVCLGVSIGVSIGRVLSTHINCNDDYE